jgi:peptide/nickel transport system substrate-binding protein
VVFSIERARAETSDFRGYVAGIVAIEAVDNRTVRFTTTAPDPALWLKLADVAIISKAWAEQHKVTTPTDYNGTREETYASRHANGTGPFMVEAFEPRGDYTLVRIPPGGVGPTIRTITSIVSSTFGRQTMPRS